MTDEGYGLLCSFDGLFNDDPSRRIEGAFVLGVEFGGVWAALKGRAEYEVTFHAENNEAFRRMATALGFDFEASPTEPPTEGWNVAKFRRRPPRSHLRIVAPLSRS